MRRRFRTRQRSSELSVVLINPFEVPAGTEDEEFLRGWQRAADYMREQPGFLNTRLHRALAPDARFRFINIAEWESPQAFRAAVTSEGFGRRGNGTPPNHRALYEVVKSI